MTAQRISIGLGLLFLVLASTASATDGRIEINEAVIAVGGVSPGDIPGYPASISVPGSYILTGNLSVGPSANGIEVTSSDVTLDLGGFSIIGPATGPFGSGVYIAGSRRNVEVRNGTVRDFVTNGIFLTYNSSLVRVIDVRALANGSTGILAQGAGNVVRGCTAAQNGLYGIRGTSGSIVTDNVVYGNTNVGLLLNDVAYGSNIVYDNNGGNANPQVNANFSVQISGNQCGLAACP